MKSDHWIKDGMQVSQSIPTPMMNGTNYCTTAALALCRKCFRKHQLAIAIVD